MVKLEDLNRLAQNYYRHTGSPNRAWKKDQVFVEAIYKHYQRTKSDYDEDILADPNPVSREDIIWQIWKKDLKGKPSDKPLIHNFDTTKSSVNSNFAKMEDDGTNSKRIRIGKIINKNNGKEGYCFVVSEPSTDRKQELKQEKRKIIVCDQQPEEQTTDFEYSDQRSYEEYRRNPFIGHESQIQQWTDIICNPQNTPATFLITGMSGTGKSHLAVWLALKSQEKNNQTKLFWVDLQGIIQTDAALTKLFAKVFGTTPQLDDSQLKERLIEKLKEEQGIIVLDDLLPSLRVEEFIQ